MSAQLVLLMEVMKGSRKLKFSRQEWNEVLDEITSAERDALLMALAPEKKRIPRTSAERPPEEPIVTDLKDAFKSIKGTIAAKIAVLEEVPTIANASDGRPRKSWQAAVNHWRKTLSDNEILESARAFAKDLEASGRRTITLDRT